jgi:hypothetical protein
MPSSEASIRRDIRDRTFLTGETRPAGFRFIVDVDERNTGLLGEAVARKPSS